MTDVSVFRRRRMYGRTRARSGAYGVCGCDDRRLVNVENAFPDPSRPGLRKSKIDQRSPRRIFHRCAAERDARPRIDLLGGPRLLGARCLDRLRFVQDGQAPRHGEQCGRAEQ